MMFGTKDEFGIEAEFVAAIEKWRMGHLRFWIHGIPIGNFEEFADLAASGRWARQFLSGREARQAASFEGISSRELLDLLLLRFVSGSETAQTPWLRDPFLLDDVGDSSLRDRVSVLVVGDVEGCYRVVAYDLATTEMFEARVPSAACDSTVDMYARWAASLD